MERNVGEFAYSPVNCFLFPRRKYGVKDVFACDDLLHHKNIPKVSRCIVQLAKLVSHILDYF